MRVNNDRPKRPKTQLYFYSSRTKRQRTHESTQIGNNPIETSTYVPDNRAHPPVKFDLRANYVS